MSKKLHTKHHWIRAVLALALIVALGLVCVGGYSYAQRKWFYPRKYAELVEP